MYCMECATRLALVHHWPQSVPPSVAAPGLGTDRAHILANDLNNVTASFYTKNICRQQNINAELATTSVT